MFKKGDKVICIKGILSLKEGQEYTILDTDNCKCEQIVNVGLESAADTLCGKCGKMIIDKGWFHYSSRFIKADEYKYMMEQINELSKKEDFVLEKQSCC